MAGKGKNQQQKQKRKTLDLPDQVVLNGKKVLEEAQAIIDEANKPGKTKIRRIPNTEFARDFVAVLTKHTLKQNPWLNIPSVIIEKILRYLPAQECWRIARRLNHHFHDWVENVTTMYELTFWIDLGSKRYKNGGYSSSSTYRDFYAIQYKDDPFNVNVLVFTDTMYFDRFTNSLTLNKVKKGKVRFSIREKGNFSNKLIESNYHDDVISTIVLNTTSLWKSEKGQLRETSKAAGKDIFYQMKFCF